MVFMREGRPAQALRIKTAEELEISTDHEGQLSLDLSTGQHKIAVYNDGSWVPHLVEVSTTSSLLIVDLDDPINGSPDGKGAGLQQSSEVSFLDIGRMNLGQRYVYEKVLGRGGMSLVIRAKDRLLNRSVAVKMLAEELLDNEEAQTLFMGEARKLATLSHPNLVAVHDICKIEDRVFIVIEYIKGENLERLIHALKGFRQNVGLKLMLQLVRVVAYLHDQGVIHRDLKPADALVRHE